MAMNHNISSPRVWKPDNAISSFTLSKFTKSCKARNLRRKIFKKQKQESENALNISRQNREMVASPSAITPDFYLLQI
jgi:hypothetical protein